MPPRSCHRPLQRAAARVVARFERGRPILEKVLGPDHPHVATSLNNLALLYKAQGDYARAEPLHKRTLAIKEKALGPDHPHVATSLENLAMLYLAMGRVAEAAAFLDRAMK
ncbi:MAG TPA: tetratricopeptide repeat protein, partial [Xanthobacteraceae bacterium]|nr:tetratricopeptide repeat protein [Xanthobacteraceae bacterium]